jgi:hypothetical protein
LNLGFDAYSYDQTIKLALRRSKYQEAKRRNRMKQHLKSKAMLAIVLFPLATLGSSASLTSGSKHSLRSLGRAKARPLTKR